MPRRGRTSSPPGNARPESPKLYLWGARTLFIGRALGLSAHRNAVAVLCAGIDAPFEIARDPRQPATGYVACRTALIPANTLHHLRAGEGAMAFLYVDARSNDHSRLAASADFAHERFGMRLANEARYLDALAALRDGLPWRQARTELASLLGLDAPVCEDERITEALRDLREHPERPHALDQVARKARLSPSRFQHLFKAATGVPFRRYKIWVRMGSAVRDMTAGRSLTDAALAAGFASSSHFSTAFREMFGLSPSQLAAARLTIATAGQPDQRAAIAGS
jgi:AraC-like DNA-binding protein